MFILAHKSLLASVTVSLGLELLHYSITLLAGNASSVCDSGYANPTTSYDIKNKAIYQMNKPERDTH